MLRGTTLFKCDECGNVFEAPDIEYSATILSAPQKCTKCGSYHTMPVSQLSLLGKMNPKRLIYKKIWEDIDKNMV